MDFLDFFLNVNEVTTKVLPRLLLDTKNGLKFAKTA